MKYRSLRHQVDAFCFRGTTESAQHAQDWLSSHDIEDVEVTWQGTPARPALDLIVGNSLTTLESGDYVVLHNGAVTSMSGEIFGRMYEAI